MAARVYPLSLILLTRTVRTEREPDLLRESGLNHEIGSEAEVGIGKVADIDIGQPQSPKMRKRLSAEDRGEENVDVTMRKEMIARTVLHRIS
jgi:hypothetical protein